MTTARRTAVTRSLLGAGLTAAMTAGLLAAAPAAQARTSYADDAAGDVTSYTFDDTNEDDLPEPVQEPDQADGDVVRIKTIHAARSVAVKVWYRDLATTSDGRNDYLRIVTNEGLRRHAYVDSEDGTWAGTDHLTDGNERRVRCAVAHTTDYAADTVVLRVPRSCLSSPRWVRLGFGTTTFDFAEDFSTFVVRQDDARRTGLGQQTDVALGGRLYRG